ncbi:MAG: CARDB domain-containing protein, partial [Acidobacteriota bacterium]
MKHFSLAFAGLLVLFAGQAFAQASDAAPAAESKSLPDLISTIKTSPLLEPNKDVTVKITVVNQGTAAAPESEYEVIIKNARAPREVIRVLKRTIRALEPNDKFSYSFSIKLGLGFFEICGTNDRKKKIKESDE